jgi:hypothetical protein
MKKILILFFFIPILVKGQLKEFEVNEMEKPKTSTTVQANIDFSDNSLILIYSSFKRTNS